MVACFAARGFRTECSQSREHALDWIAYDRDACHVLIDQVSSDRRERPLRLRSGVVGLAPLPPAGAEVDDIPRPAQEHRVRRNHASLRRHAEARERKPRDGRGFGREYALRVTIAKD